MPFSYLILDVLGAGTFGQVVKCQNTKTNEIVAVKVVKNKQAYFNQSMMELAILEMVSPSPRPSGLQCCIGVSITVYSLILPLNNSSTNDTTRWTSIIFCGSKILLSTKSTFV